MNPPSLGWVKHFKHLALEKQLPAQEVVNRFLDYAMEEDAAFKKRWKDDSKK
jgi:hypothetical protein